MKNIKYIFILLIILIPLNGYAIEFYCDRNVLANKEFKCIISNSSNSLYNLTATLEYPAEFNLVKEVYSKGYNNNGNNKELNIAGPGFNAPTTIGILTFKVPDIGINQTYNINLNNIKYKYLSTEVNYHDNEKDLSSTINVKGNGSNQTTTSTPTTTKVNNIFDLTIHYMNDTSDDTLSCEAKTNNCTINISDIELPTKEGYEFVGWSNDSTCAEYNNNQTFELTTNKDIYACYKINNDEKSNLLESLTIVGYPLEFDKFVDRYTLAVDADVTKLEINAKAVSDTAKIIISDNVNNLVDGENTIKIDVIDNNVTTTYYIIVNKNIVDKPMLTNIIIENYKLNFSSDKYIYTLKVKYGTQKLNMNIINDDNYEYIVTGNENLKDNSKIIINVKSDSSESNYNINIKYESFIVSYLYYIYGISFALFCIIVYFVVKYLRSDKYKNKKENKEKKNLNLEPEKDKVKNNKKGKKKEKKPKKETIEKL